MINRVHKQSPILNETLFQYNDADIRKDILSNLSFNWVDIVCLDENDDPITPSSGEFIVYVKTNELSGFEKVDRPIQAAKCGGSSMPDGFQLGAFYGSFILELKVIPVDVVGASSYITYVRQSDFGKTPVLPTKTYDEAIASGEIQGAYGFFAFGRNQSISADTEEFVIDFANQYTFLETAEQLYISSSSASDTSVTMVIRVLDENYVQHDIVQTINGQAKTPVNLPNALRVIFTFNGGSTLQQGDVYVYSDTTVTNGVPDDLTKVLAKSDTAKQQSNMANFTVPFGKYALIRAIVITANKSNNTGAADVYLNTRERNGVRRRRAELGLQTGGSSQFTYSFEIPIRFEYGTDIFLTAEPTVNNYDIAGGFQLQIEDA